MAESYLLVYGIAYYLLMPTMFIFMGIYAYVGLNNTSWGTREAKTEGMADGKDDSFALCTCKLGSLWKCKFCYMPKSMVAGDVIKEEKKQKYHNKVEIKNLMK